MGYIMSRNGADRFFAALGERYALYAPMRFKGGGRFSDTDCVRYGVTRSLGGIEFAEKSSGTFREALTPITQTLFYFTEDDVREPNPPEKPAIIFLRSCDLHAARRQDDMYLRNGAADYYYERVRRNVKFALIPCAKAFDSCFCADMGTNRSEDYDLSVEIIGGEVHIDCKDAALAETMAPFAEKEAAVVPSFVTENPTRVKIPENMSPDISKSAMWDEYDGRCIACGRCNFSCPTCACYTTQDIFSSDNGRAGERRRVWASCMVDGFTDVAGGGCYRRKNGERMRFKTLHKIRDHQLRFGCQMCVGCGRCDDVCPEYISFSRIISRLSSEAEEAGADA
jgi:anaerobic sulfite reductase subunit A